MEEISELAGNVAGLPSEIIDEYEEAKRFDMLVLRAQLGILQAHSVFSDIQEKIQDIALALEAQDSIPVIKAQMVLIQAVAGDDWWQECDRDHAGKHAQETQGFGQADRERQAHDDHISLQRLRRNLPLTPSDLEELEKMHHRCRRLEGTDRSGQGRKPEFGNFYSLIGRIRAGSGDAGV